MTLETSATIHPNQSSNLSTVGNDGHYTLRTTVHHNTSNNNNIYNGDNIPSEASPHYHTRSQSHLVTGANYKPYHSNPTFKDDSSGPEHRVIGLSQSTLHNHYDDINNNNNNNPNHTTTSSALDSTPYNLRSLHSFNNSTNPNSTFNNNTTTSQYKSSPSAETTKHYYDNKETTSPTTYCTRLYASPAMNILCLTTMSEVNPHLYISGASAVNEYKVRGKGITFIVNITLDFPNLRVPGVESVAIRIDDSPSAQLYPYFDSVADKIKEVSQRAGKNGAAGGKTLVHCMVGASRSATLVLAYLMKHRKMSLLQAYSFLKRIRPVIRPNPGFFKQLVAYEYTLFGHNTVKMVFAAPPYRGLIPDIYLCEY